MTSSAAGPSTNSSSRSVCKMMRALEAWTADDEDLGKLRHDYREILGRTRISKRLSLKYESSRRKKTWDYRMFIHLHKGMSCTVKHCPNRTSPSFTTAVRGKWSALRWDSFASTSEGIRIRGCEYGSRVLLGRLPGSFPIARVGC